MICLPRVRVWAEGVKGCKDGMKCSETGMNGIAGMRGFITCEGVALRDDM